MIQVRTQFVTDVREELRTLTGCFYVASEKPTQGYGGTLREKSSKVSSMGQVEIVFEKKRIPEIEWHAETLIPNPKVLIRKE
jgi:hypothetical protein